MARLEARVAALEAPLEGGPLVVRCISLIGQVSQPAAIRRIGTEKGWVRTSNETAEHFRARVDAQLSSDHGLVILLEQNASSEWAQE